MKLIPLFLLAGMLAASGWAEDKVTYSLELAKKAEAGDAKAQYDLGRYYESYARENRLISNETKQIMKFMLQRAAFWYAKAAEQGNMGAQYNLGRYYEWEYEKDGTKDYEKAIKWYTKAEEQGDERSQARLGFCYFWGHGVKQDLKEAVKWYTKSAEQGDVKAQCYLANCYVNGLGVPKNKKEAIKWYTKALEGDTGGEAQHELKKLKSQ